MRQYARHDKEAIWNCFQFETIERHRRYETIKLLFDSFSV